MDLPLDPQDCGVDRVWQVVVHGPNVPTPCVHMESGAGFCV